MIYTGTDVTLGTMNATSSNVDKVELMKQLQVLNLSIETVKVIVIAVLLNLYFVYLNRVKILDLLNNTDCARRYEKPEKIQDVANIMFIYATGIFLYINSNQFEQVNSVQGKSRDLKAITIAYRSLITAILAFVASLISRVNIETQRSKT